MASGASLSVSADNLKNINNIKFISALQGASANGHLDIVKALLELGSDVNERGGYHGSCLQAATEGGHMEVIRFFLDAGAIANEASIGKHSSALLIAAENNHLDAVRLLVERGADPNMAAGGPFAYPLQAAAFAEEDDMLQLLISLGADVNSKGGRFCTALQASAKNGNAEAVRVLIDNGADVNAVGGQYGTALAAAYSEGYYSCTGLLYQHDASSTIVAGMYDGALGAALSGSCQTLVIQLIRYHGADVKSKIRVYGNSIQHFIRIREDEEILHTMLEHGADVNAIGGQFGTLLNAAAFEGNVDWIRLLLEKGADPSIRASPKFWSPLISAIVGKEYKAAKFLIERGCDPNEVGSEWGCPLHAALAKSSLCIVKFALSKRARPLTGVGIYSNCLTAAATCRTDSRLRLMVNRRGDSANACGGIYGSPLVAPALQAAPHLVDILLQQGANVNQTGGYYKTPLIAAAAAGCWRVMLPLLQRGADVNIYGGKYNSAIQAASASGDETAVRMLLEKGADVNATGGKYRIALYAAALHGHEKLVKILLKNGAERKLLDRSANNMKTSTADAADELLQRVLESRNEEDNIGAAQGLSNTRMVGRRL